MQLGAYLCTRVCARGVRQLGHEHVLVVTWLWVTETSRCQRRRWHHQWDVCLCVAAEGSVSSAMSPKSFAGTKGGLVPTAVPTSST